MTSNVGGVSRCLFKTLSIIYDGAFCEKCSIIDVWYGPNWASKKMVSLW